MWKKFTASKLVPMLHLEVANKDCSTWKVLKEAVSRNSAKLGNYKMPVKLEKHKNKSLKL